MKTIILLLIAVVGVYCITVEEVATNLEYVAISVQIYRDLDDILTKY